jgi:hypothetical protein
MLKYVLPVTALLVISSVVVNAHDDMSKPEIKVETRLNNKGKKVSYMFIDGVLVHETDPAKQPQPVVVAPGTESTPDVPGKAPSDAIVLFDGSAESFAGWTDVKGNPTKWKLVDGTLESVKKAGYIQTKHKFGSCQLHIEWAAPNPPKGNGQKRGNSGLFLQGIYEIQILDCYENKTYPDGQAGALYGRSKPLVNACRKPGVWQSYDVVFHRPIFKDGKVVRRATFTVLHNGVLVQDHVVLSGGTDWRGVHAVSDYSPHADKLPLKLQDHGNPVHFRNIWIRELDD